MKSCFGYVRVSTLKQGDGASLQAQQEAVTQFASANDTVIVKWYKETQTAAKKGRPIFNEMLKALKLGKADGVIMHRIDRSARNFFDWAKIGELADQGIGVHFATESLDFQSRGGRLTANIQMAVAEDYVRNLKIEIHKGQRARLKQGLLPFSTPIGYQNGGNHTGKPKTPDPVMGPLVKRAFELYAGGEYSQHTLRIELNRLGLRNNRGKPISKGCVEHILANPFYCGIIQLKRTGEVFQGIHEPLISADLFESVQATKSNRHHKKNTRHKYLYRCLFQCAKCKRSIIAERQRDKIYYRCHTPGCQSKCVREEKIEAEIAKILQCVTLKEQDTKTVTVAVEDWCTKAQKSAEVGTYAMQLKNLEDRIEKLDDAAIEQIISKEVHAGRMKKLLLENACLKEKRTEAEKFRANPALVNKFLERIKNVAQHYMFAVGDEKREIVKLMTSNRVFDAGNVYVEPANWLIVVQNAVDTLVCADARASSRRLPETRNSGIRSSCADDRANSRRLSELRNQQLAALAEISQSDVVGKIEAVFADKNEPSTMKR